MDPQFAVSHALVPSFSKVDTKEERDHYWKHLLHLWGRPARQTHHPGCNPRSLSRDRLSHVHSGDFSVSLKSDGCRYTLLMTLRKGTSDQPVALMIDRARNMYEVEVLASEDYFVHGTILEGELVWLQPNEERMAYLVFDAVRVKGAVLLKEPFRERLRAAEACTRLSEELAAVPDCEDRVLETDTVCLVHYKPSLVMRPKTFVDRSFAERLWNNRSECCHRVDGVILQDMEAPYTCGTADNGCIYKWKDHSSVDLLYDGKALQCADAPLPAEIHGRSVVLRESRVSQPEMVIEFHVSVTPDEVTLFPLRTRPDRLHANGLRVVLATVHDVIENIGIAELVSV